MLGASLILAAALSTPSGDNAKALVGVQVGLDFSKVAEVTGLERPADTGGVLAAYVALPLSRHVWIQPDLSIARRKLSVGYGKSSDQVELRFAEVAMLAVFSIGIERSYLFCGVGPSLAVRVGAIQSGYHLYEDWRRASFEVLAVAGVGLDVSQRLTGRLEFRYVHGLQDLDPALDHWDRHLGSAQLKFGLEWRLRR